MDLTDLPIGPYELDCLLQHWRKEPRPLSVEEIAQLYLSLQIEARHGLHLYDCRRAYEIGDRIVVYKQRQEPLDLFGTGGSVIVLEPVEVVDVHKAAHRDAGGFTWDCIDVRPLGPLPAWGLTEQWQYISNYPGQEDAAPPVQVELVQEMEKAGLLAKILAAISGDHRFVAFQRNWLPAELLVSRLEGELDNVKLLTARAKQAISVTEILAALLPRAPAYEVRLSMEFSLGYFLERDGRFTCGPATEGKWDLNPPADPVEITFYRPNLEEGEFAVSDLLDQMLCYHGCVRKCHLVLPDGDQVEARYYMSRRRLVSEGLAAKLRGQVGALGAAPWRIWLWHPDRRGGAIRLSMASDRPPRLLEIGREWTVTVQEPWLDEGTLRMPALLAGRLAADNNLSVIYGEGVQLAAGYKKGSKFLSGLDAFYRAKALAPGDKVHLRLEACDPLTILVTTHWKRSLAELLKLEPEDLEWERSSLRDCIIVVLGRLGRCAYYREIYARVAAHKRVSLGSVLATLSRYTPAVFAHVSHGQWSLAGPAASAAVAPGGERVPVHAATSIPPEVWQAVARLEACDYVYRLLEKLARPLSYDDICGRAASALRIDPDQLRATGFLDATDPRLRRMDDGTWGLQKWFPPAAENTVEVSSRRLARYWWLVVLVLIAVSVLGALACTIIWGWRP
jgi:hypothetical protein